MKNGRFHATMACACLAVAVFSVIGMQQAKITVSMGPLCVRVLVLVALFAGAAFYHWRGHERLHTMMAMTFWAALVTNLHMFPMFIAARADVEMSDALLATVDAALGVEVPDVLQFMSAMPMLSLCMRIAYDLLIILIMLAIILPVHFNQVSKAKEFAIACLVSAIVGMTIFAFFQAAGPWTYYGYAPSAGQERYIRLFTELKLDEWFVLDVSFGDGLITFPSFHAALAIMAAWALWFNRYLRWPAAFLALAITVSTVTSGWHYISDTLAGVVLAFIGIGAGRAYLWLESRGVAQTPIEQ